MSTLTDIQVVQVALRPEGVLVMFADGSYSVYPEALLYGSRELARVMSGLGNTDLVCLMPVVKR